MEGKNIKVYGTLINLTLNTEDSMRDSQHNDLIAVAYQLYDERFAPKKGSGANFAVTAIDRYQDIINKRLTAIYFDDLNTQDGGDDITYIDSKVNIGGDTNIEKNLTVEGDTNIEKNLTVEGDTNIEKNLTVEGDTTFEGDVNITGDVNLNIGLNDLNDVTLSTMAIGQVLRYNGSKWVNAKLSIDDLEMPAAVAGLVLKFNGTKWVADIDETGDGTQLPEGSEGKVLKYINGLWVAADDLIGATKMSELSDVDTTGIAVNKILKWNGTKWVVSTDETGDGGATKLSELSDVDSSVDNATNGQVLKFNGTKWVAAEDEVGESGGIPSGDNYPTLKKYRVKMNLVATCTPSIYFKLTGDDDETAIKNSGNISYLYKSENEVNIGPGEIILNKAIESFNNDNHYIKYFTSNSKSLLESFGYIADEKCTVNGTVMNAYNNFNRYMILPSVYLSASTENVTCIPEKYNSNITYDYFINSAVNSLTINDVSNSLDQYIPVTTNCRNYIVNSTSNIDQSNIYGGYDFTTIESGKYVTYCANSKYLNLYGGLLTGPYYKKVYDNNKKTEDDGDTYVNVTITNISESEFKNKVKWSNGLTTIQVPRKYPFTVLTEASNIQMPDYIYGYITTIS